MALSEDVNRIAAAAAAHAAPDETVAAVLAVETAAGERVYLSAFADAAGNQEWLALTDDGAPVTSKERVREAASVHQLVDQDHLGSSERAGGLERHQLRIAGSRADEVDLAAHAAFSFRACFS